MSAQPLRSSMSLTVLGDEAASAHRHAGESLTEGLRWAIRCGHALELGSRKLSDGQTFPEWTKSLGIARTTAYKYRRLARNAGKLRDFRGGIDDATLALSDPFSRPRVTAKARREAVRMVLDEGVSMEEAARRLGIATSTAWYWSSPKNQRMRGTHRRRTRSRAKLAEIELKRREGDRLARKADGAIPKGYALLRQAAQQIDAARAAEEEPEVRTALEKALGHIYAAEQETVRAMGMYVEGEQAA